MKKIRYLSWCTMIGGAVLCCASITFAQFGGFNIGDAIKGGENAKKIIKGAAGVSLNEELDVGGSLALEIASKKGGILKNQALTERVATIGKALTLYCTRPELHFTFAVLDNPEINAFACPGGYVFVTKGLVDSCKNDQQLASTLAHEIAHVTRRHALKLISGKELTQGLLGAGSMAAGGSDYGVIDGAVTTIAENIIDKGLPKGDEYDADKYGTRLSYDAGFPPRTLRDYLESLRQKSDDTTFSTHPKLQDRVERLDEYMKESGLVPEN